MNLNELINIFHIDDLFLEKLNSYIDYDEVTDSVRKSNVHISVYTKDDTISTLCHLCLNYGKSLFEYSSTLPQQKVIRRGMEVSILNDHYENRRINRGKFLKDLQEDLNNQNLEKLKTECRYILYKQYSRTLKPVEDYTIEQIAQESINILGSFDYKKYNIKKCLEEFLKTKNFTYLILSCFLQIHIENSKMLDLILESKAFSEHQHFIRQLKRK